MTAIRSYSQLLQFDTLESRFDYLSLKALPFDQTFGAERWVNQAFYTSREWKRARRDVIARDYGCDLGIEGFEIYGKLYVHHMNPMSLEDIVDGKVDVLDPEFLITVSHRTHNAIHYGDFSQLPQPLVQRTSGDTTLW